MANCLIHNKQDSKIMTEHQDCIYLILEPQMNICKCQFRSSVQYENSTIVSELLLSSSAIVAYLISFDEPLHCCLRYNFIIIIYFLNIHFFMLSLVRHLSHIWSLDTSLKIVHSGCRSSNSISSVTLILPVP